MNPLWAARLIIRSTSFALRYSKRLTQSARTSSTESSGASASTTNRTLSLPAALDTVSQYSPAGAPPSEILRSMAPVR